ncbi:hypothetical protein [Actinomarinicola tropica]|uniref:Uncharacterized protein n=1 Tax=Actinomarinicola tropica TaxID=2789776 RepID=A0A5Q2RSF8_9ACTN|nr:hypothetical protein [Actinomarinicola tropica]QGG96840.1 hypothetical protein GH723_18015 [Actinomarinicola tropica]
MPEDDERDAEEPAPAAPEDREASGDAPATGRRPIAVLVAVGLLVGVLGGVGVAWLVDDGDGSDDAPVEPEGPAETAEAADALLVAWERSRTATFLSGSLLRRTTAAGATVELPIVVAQRPPDRVVSTGSSVSGVVGGETRVCDEQLDGLVRCRSVATERDAAAAVERELATLAGYLEGDLPLYRVAQDGDCFSLRLARAIHAPPYGQNARFCFDAESGAPSLQRVERAEGTDEVTLLSVRTDVTDADLERVAAGDVDLELLEDRTGG